MTARLRVWPGLSRPSTRPVAERMDHRVTPRTAREGRLPGGGDERNW
jgi:hypothetical protein